jgi:hypothetical protein
MMNVEQISCELASDVPAFKKGGSMIADQNQITAPPSYAVIFRTHFWDDFAKRQFERLAARVTTGDIYVLVDETNGPVAGIQHDKVVRLTEQDLLDMGLLKAGTGNLLWFNGDYPLYYFMKDHGSYDYYIYLEYDVTLNVDVDPLVRRIAADKVDFIGLTKGEPVAEWAWLHTCQGVYPAKDIQYKLICMSFFSHRALEVLAARRLELSKQFRNSVISNWPFCEGFIATEMNRNGFVSAELAAYIDTTAYDTWPPFLENDLPIMTGNPVIHPVLDRERYIGSLLKYKVGLIGYVNINSLLHRKLRRLPPSFYLKTLARTFTQKAIRTLRSHRLLPG